MPGFRAGVYPRIGQSPVRSCEPVLAIVRASWWYCINSLCSLGVICSGLIITGFVRIGYRWLSVGRSALDDVSSHQWGEPVASDNGRAPTDRWLRVLWLAAIRGRGPWLLQSACERAPSCLVMEAGWYVSGLCTLCGDQLKSCRWLGHCFCELSCGAWLMCGFSCAVRIGLWQNRCLDCRAGLCIVWSIDGVQ